MFRLPYHQCSVNCTKVEYELLEKMLEELDEEANRNMG